jgi:hypothetical protein
MIFNASSPTPPTEYLRDGGWPHSVAAILITLTNPVEAERTSLDSAMRAIAIRVNAVGIEVQLSCVWWHRAVKDQVTVGTVSCRG